MAAAKTGYVDVVQLLLSEGADPKVRDYTGRTALMWAQWNRKLLVIQLLQNANIRE